MKRLLAYLFIFFALSFFYIGSASAEPKFCSTSDFTSIFSGRSADYICPQKTYWSPMEGKAGNIIQLNAKIFNLMDQVEKRVVKELRDMQRRTGKNMGHLFYDLLNKYRSEIYEDNKSQLIAKKEPSQTQKNRK